jgi:hypothetical protein
VACISEKDESDAALIACDAYDPRKCARRGSLSFSRRTHRTAVFTELGYRHQGYYFTEDLKNP